MSFLFDPPLLVAAGYTIERAVPDEQRECCEALTLGTFIGVSYALYNDVPGLGAFWKPFRASGGRDFMLNSGVFRFESREVGWPTHLAAAAIFSTYPLWLKLGRRLGRRAGG